MLSRTALALSALVLSSCSGGSGPGPSVLPKLTAGPSPTVTLAPVPPAATAFTPQGADAFVRYFFDQMNVAFQTSNASIIDALSTPACVTCNNYESSLRAALKNGHFLSGPSFEVTAVAASPTDSAGSSADVVGKIPARDSIDGTGKVLQHLPAKPRFYFIVTVIRRSATWAVNDIALGTP